MNYSLTEMACSCLHPRTKQDEADGTNLCTCLMAEGCSHPSESLHYFQREEGTWVAKMCDACGYRLPCDEVSHETTDNADIIGPSLKDCLAVIWEQLTYKTDAPSLNSYDVSRETMEEACECGRKDHKREYPSHIISKMKQHNNNKWMSDMLESLQVNHSLTSSSLLEDPKAFEDEITEMVDAWNDEDKEAVMYLYLWARGMTVDKANSIKGKSKKD